MDALSFTAAWIFPYTFLLVPKSPALSQGSKVSHESLFISFYINVYKSFI